MFTPGGAYLPFISPSAHEIKGHTKGEHDHAVDGHDLVRGVPYIIRIRTHSNQMPREEGDPDNAYNYSSGLHKKLHVNNNEAAAPCTCV